MIRNPFFANDQDRVFKIYVINNTLGNIFKYEILYNPHAESNS
ncbi:Uncharacterised protein [Staphylococcus piscifermentans]|nr:Uncharacterised protein [Staphylococcus piscifermentans]